MYKRQVMRFVNNSWEMEESGRAEYVVKDNYIQIKVSASLIGVVSDVYKRQL